MDYILFSLILTLFVLLFRKGKLSNPYQVNKDNYESHICAFLYRRRDKFIIIGFIVVVIIISFNATRGPFLEAPRNCRACETVLLSIPDGSFKSFENCTVKKQRNEMGFFRGQNTPYFSWDFDFEIRFLAR